MSAGKDIGGEHAGSDRINEFTAFRQRMNERILGEDNQVIRRFFALDTQTYKPGALDEKTKELHGLVASMVLPSDDCISSPLAQSKRVCVPRAEFFAPLVAAWGVGGRSGGHSSDQPQGGGSCDQDGLSADPG